jgi:hypothetical protein
MVSRYFPASWISRSGPVRARDCAHASPRTRRARYSKSVSVRDATSRRTRPLCTVRAVDPDTVGRKLAAQRVAAAPVPVEYALHGEELPLDDDSIDHASTTWTIGSYGAVALSVRRDLSLDGLRSRRSRTCRAARSRPRRSCGQDRPSGQRRCPLRARCAHDVRRRGGTPWGERAHGAELVR